MKWVLFRIAIYLPSGYNRIFCVAVSTELRCFEPAGSDNVACCACMRLPDGAFGKIIVAREHWALAGCKREGAFCICKTKLASAKNGTRLLCDVHFLIKSHSSLIVIIGIEYVSIDAFILSVTWTWLYQTMIPFQFSCMYRTQTTKLHCGAWNLAPCWAILPVM